MSDINQPPRILSALPKPRGRGATYTGGMEHLRLLPNHRPGRYFVYAVGFNGGVVKVGMSRDPRGRIASHWKRAGGEVLWAHVFEGGTQSYARTAERRACDALKKIAKPINSSEWFYADDKAAVLGAIRGVIRGAKEDTAKWDRERSMAAARSAKAMRLLAEHEAATPEPAKV